jgi:predicted acetyltransferase
VTIEIRTPPPSELRRFLEIVAKTFTEELHPEDAARDERVLDPARLFAAYDGDTIVGTAVDFGLTLTIPGGELPAAGVTAVGVLPTHRRRGILNRLMRAEIDAMVDRGEPLAILWASEAPIYGRYGYGISTVSGAIAAERDRIGFRDDAPPTGSVRLVDEEEAARVLPPIYDRVRRATPGMFERTEEWWLSYRLPDPERHRHGAGPRFFAVLQIDGVDEGFARYRVKDDWQEGVSTSSLRVTEALATTPTATRELWQFLFGVDLVAKVEAWTLAADHPLFLLVTEPRRLHLRLGDALWVRILDIERALTARSYATEGSLALELSDSFLPANAGVWRLEASGGDARATRVEGGDAELRLDVGDLASTYLGGFSFARLARARRLEELAEGAVDRADALFRTSVGPWCPEVF